VIGLNGIHVIKRAGEDTKNVLELKKFQHLMEVWHVLVWRKTAIVIHSLVGKIAKFLLGLTGAHVISHVGKEHKQDTEIL
jgi:hypothetical protein